MWWPLARFGFEFLFLFLVIFLSFFLLSFFLGGGGRVEGLILGSLMGIGLFSSFWFVGCVFS